MLQLEFPWALALIPLPLLVYWLAPEFRDHGEAVRVPFFVRLVNLTGKDPQSGAVVQRKGALQLAVGIASWLLVIAALTKPVWVGEPVVQEKSARDMLLIVDLSQSMDEKDFTGASGETVSRLEAVKVVLRDFIKRREKDRVGLAVFGNAAFPQAPFTEDHATVIALLDELSTGMAGPKTMIGDAIGLAIRLFEASDKQSKVAILLTDGNDSGSQMPVSRAAQIASENGIVIHTIAMGDPTTIGEQELDTEALKNIADTTGGKYFLALDKDALENIYAELDQLAPELLETISYRPKHQLFYYPLAALVVSILALAATMLLAAARQEHAHA